MALPSPDPTPTDTQVANQMAFQATQLVAMIGGGPTSATMESPWKGWRITKFIDEVLGIDLWERQWEIAESVDDNFATAVKSCHGAGKSYLMAAVVLAYVHTRQPSIAVTTAPTTRQVKNVLWRAIRRHHGAARKQLMGSRPLQLEYNIADDHFAIGFKGEDEDSDSAQGYHSPNLLVVVDEAAGVAESVINAMDNIVTGDGSRIVYIGNPTSVSGRFRRAFHEDAAQWNTISIPAHETPNIKYGRTVIDGLIDQRYVDRTIQTYGEDSPWTMARIHAIFPDQDDRSLISLSWVEAASERNFTDLETSEDSPIRCGVDVARGGSDESTIFIRLGDVIVHRSWMVGNDNMEVAAKVREALSEVAERFGVDPYDDIETRVDVIGTGSGVADRLRELGYRVVDVNVSRKSSDREKFPNLRAELWWSMGDRFRLGRVGFDRNAKQGLDEQTRSQLVSIRAKYVSNYSRPVVESKDDMKKRLGRSPDRAEGLMLCLAEDWQLREGEEATPGTWDIGGVSGWAVGGPGLGSPKSSW